jgi:hypothetical protein
VRSPITDSDNQGSPNGLAAGYFLLQHKRQLGGNKYISKIRVFRKDDDNNPKPNLLFYVDDQAPPDPKTLKREDRGREEVESRVVGRSKDGTSLVREHVFRARL